MAILESEKEQQKKIIELLAPAKDLECGLEAIKSGADAIYIGSTAFGARSKSTNSVQDIKRLTEYAHVFGVRVYVTLNTILTDDELIEAEKLIWELWEVANIDALIIQDMGVTQLNLPPIPLHASTQMDNRSLEKIQFLEEVGFRQIVLPREFSIDEIKKIANNTNVPLEYFIHGALCVSYSGQCFISEAFAKRSANKGSCAQYCRLPYKLHDNDGKIIEREGHYLSMKDLNLTNNLENLILAGISSFKIEGRMKDVAYVKNVVSHYDICLKKILKKYDNFRRASFGHVERSFVPNINKSFNRGFTNYFVSGRNEKDLWSFNSPKSVGELLGSVISENPLRIDTKETLSNGDGICYFDEKKMLKGFYIDKVIDKNTIKTAHKIKKGTLIYRNHNKKFDIEIIKNNSTKRVLPIKFVLTEINDVFQIEAIDISRGIIAQYKENYQKIKAEKSQKQQVINTLEKTGDTFFKVVETLVEFNDDFFIPLSKINEWKRNILILLEKKIIEYYNSNKEKVVLPDSNAKYFKRDLTYLDNIMNEKAKVFYEKHGCNIIQPAFEFKSQKNVPLMFTKHCIKYSIGLCPKETRKKNNFSEPWILTHKNINLKVEFDCRNCIMKILDKN